MGASARAFILSLGFIVQVRIIQNAPPSRKMAIGGNERWLMEHSHLCRVCRSPPPLRRFRERYERNCEAEAACPQKRRERCPVHPASAMKEAR